MLTEFKQLLAVYYFRIGEYKKSLEQLNYIESKDGIVYNVYIVRPLRFLNYFEMNKFDLLHNQLNLIHRNKEHLYDLEMLLYDFLKRFAGNGIKKENRLQLRNSIKKGIDNDVKISICTNTSNLIHG